MSTITCPICGDIYAKSDADYIDHLHFHVKQGKLVSWRWEFDSPKTERLSTPERVQSVIQRYGENKIIVSKIDTIKGAKNARGNHEHSTNH